MGLSLSSPFAKCIQAGERKRESEERCTFPRLWSSLFSFGEMKKKDSSLVSKLRSPLRVSGWSEWFPPSVRTTILYFAVRDTVPSRTNENYEFKIAMRSRDSWLGTHCTCKLRSEQICMCSRDEMCQSRPAEGRMNYSKPKSFAWAS